MKLSRPLHRGVLVRRYKRFLADVRLEDGRETTVHCPNPGAMTGLDEPGSAVVVTESANPKRKLPMTLELVRAGRSWVDVHAARANALVAEALEGGRLPELGAFVDVHREIPLGESRIDFLLAGRLEPLYLEVKSVTLARGTTALFPDAVTARGRRHLEELTAAARRGERAALLLVVARGDCRRFRPAEDIDPAWSAALRVASAAGVTVHARASRVRADAVAIAGPLPVEL